MTGRNRAADVKETWRWERCSTFLHCCSTLAQLNDRRCVCVCVCVSCRWTIFTSEIISVTQLHTPQYECYIMSCFPPHLPLQNFLIKTHTHTLKVCNRYFKNPLALRDATRPNSVCDYKRKRCVWTRRVCVSMQGFFSLSFSLVLMITARGCGYGLPWQLLLRQKDQKQRCRSHERIKAPNKCVIKTIGSIIDHQILMSWWEAIDHSTACISISCQSNRR